METTLASFQATLGICGYHDGGKGNDAWSTQAVRVKLCVFTQWRPLFGLAQFGGTDFDTSIY